MTTIAQALQDALAQLRELSPSARLDAELLLAHVTGWPRSSFIAYPERALADEQRAALAKLLARRAQGEPIAYLTGVREFWSLTLTVTPEVLIPRPETELLVELALERLDSARAARVLDLGTGSGAIALAIAKERPRAHVTATDISAEALHIARTNAELLGLTNVRCLLGEWLVPVADERFDLIVSNPPYIAADDPALEPHVRSYEPTLALIPGPRGLEAFESIVTAAPAHLTSGGWLLLEHGWEQGNAVRALLVQAGFAHVRSHPDLAGKERVSTGRWQR
jgi:release factor glutamine methyltransferase